MAEYKQGVLNIRKEKGYTSHDVVAIIRKITRMKTGHTGTLDPDATGVLPICLGRATKFAEHFAASDKSYFAELVLGITTDTGDISGKILSQTDTRVGFEEIVQAAESFKFAVCVDYMQTPPMFSAIKIGGKKLYELARKGQTIERPARAVKIFGITVLEKDKKIFLDITCSKGTYIRSLCLDIGERLGCGAVMGELTRTRSGIFSLENSCSLSEIKTAAENNSLNELIHPLNTLLPYPEIFIKPEALPRALNGNPVPLNSLQSDLPQNAEKFWLNSPTNHPIGLYSLKNNTLRTEVML
jgi:tRNA pseudouridine55 synthase